MKVSSAFVQKIALSKKKDFPATGFLLGRIPGLTLPTDRKAALQVQRPLHQKIIEALFPRWASGEKLPLVYAEQVHGADIATIAPPFLERVDNVDGLITAHSEVILGVTVADCAPVWIIEKNGKVGALLHSGKRGTEAGILSKAITRFETEFQISPSELIVTIGPCIRPPCYEIDFAETIREQALQAGVQMIQDEKICTACHLERYYSYRREKGHTGHMLAGLLLTPTPPQ